MSLADAQTLAIRRFLSLSTYDNNIAPGPPLPKSHRPPAFLAKLHIECATLYSSARQLAKTSGSSRNSSRDSKEVSSDLRRYLHNQANFHHALSHKWLGVDAGEKGGTERGGEAVGFVQWAKKELEELKDSGRLVTIGHDEKEREEIWKRELNEALSSVNVFYKYYQKMNDTVGHNFRGSVLPVDRSVYRFIFNLFLCKVSYRPGYLEAELQCQLSHTSCHPLLLVPVPWNTCIERRSKWTFLGKLLR